MTLNTIRRAVALAVALSGAALPAWASETLVSCFSPVATVNTGRDGTSPRLTIQCLGGSTAPNISYFANEISVNGTVSLLLERAYADALAQAHGKLTKIDLYSDLADLSGAGWGCGASNCRIMDQLAEP